MVDTTFIFEVTLNYFPEIEYHGYLFYQLLILNILFSNIWLHILTLDCEKDWFAIIFMCLLDFNNKVILTSGKVSFKFLSSS